MKSYSILMVREIVCLKIAFVCVINIHVLGVEKGLITTTRLLVSASTL